MTNLTLWANGLVALTKIIPALKTIKSPSWLRHTLFRRPEDELIKCLLPANENLDMVVGKANKQALAESKENSLSPYLSFAHKNLDAFYSALHPQYNREPQNYLDTEMLLHGNNNILLLGGPIANDGTLQLGGYEKINRINQHGKEINFPIFNPKNGIALGFFCGEEDYGYRDGIQQLALRYENAKEREGAIFSIKNVRARKEIFFNTEEYKGKHFISEEGLIITRIPHTNKDADDKAIVIIGGAHGFSSKAFATNLAANLIALNKLIDGMKYYQVFIPCKITHNHAYRLSEGSLMWDDPRIVRMELSRDEL